MKTLGTGYIPDFGDARDLRYFAAPVRLLSESVDLSMHMPLVWDQGSTSSCVGQAVAAAWYFANLQNKRESIDPSRLFVYYVARKLEGREDIDDGCMIRDAIKGLAKYGTCQEQSWPFRYRRVKLEPTVECYIEAETEQLLEYRRVCNDHIYLRSCLAEGFPIVCGITLYESFMTTAVARTGKVLMPTSKDRVVGGHAVLVVGYNTKRDIYICRNSWGKRWGKQGYFEIPTSYLEDEDLMTDAWTLRKTE